ncbi:MAG: ribbon-helix-helix protein, CopG family [Chloroflexi bacterium]|nr:ribbon-helix-helix protein, CopG family [Chloroflexota bacterium]
MHKTTVYLPDDLSAELERLAEETGHSEADLIREGIRLAIAQHLPPPPRSGIFASGDAHLSERVDELLRGFGKWYHPPSIGFWPWQRQVRDQPSAPCLLLELGR